MKSYNKTKTDASWGEVPGKETPAGAKYQEKEKEKEKTQRAKERKETQEEKDHTQMQQKAVDQDILKVKNNKNINQNTTKDRTHKDPRTKAGEIVIQNGKKPSG